MRTIFLFLFYSSPPQAHPEVRQRHGKGTAGNTAHGRRQTSGLAISNAGSAWFDSTVRHKPKTINLYNIMEMDIKIKLPESRNIYEAEFSLSISGMKISNREALRTLPEKIEQSFIDCIELQYGEKFSQQVKKTFSQRMCQDNEERSQS